MTAASHCEQGQVVLAACTPSAGMTSWIHQLVPAHFFPQLGATHEILHQLTLPVSQMGHSSSVGAVPELLASYRELTSQITAMSVPKDTIDKGVVSINSYQLFAAQNNGD